MGFINKYNDWTLFEKISQDLMLDYILNTNISESKRYKITKQIESDDALKKWYLFEKGKYDIERYFDGELTASEEAVLMEQIKKDNKLKEHFNLYCEVDIFLKLKAIEDTYLEELTNLKSPSVFNIEQLLKNKS